MSGKLRIFISSVQKEFAEERASVRDYLRGVRIGTESAPSSNIA